MFPYELTADDLLERFDEQRLVELTASPVESEDEEEETPPVRDDVKIERAAADAAGELELHAGRYYVTPLDPFTPALRAIFLDLWAWRLVYNCRPLWLNTQEPSDDNYALSRRRKEIVRWLEGLSSPERRAVLPGCTELSARTSASGVWSESRPAQMTPRNLWRVP